VCSSDLGVDDPLDGQAIKAVIVLRPGAELSAEKVKRHCRTKLEAYMVPKLIEFRLTLPKTPSGKMYRRELRDAPA